MATAATPKDPKNVTGSPGNAPKAEPVGTPDTALANQEVADGDKRTEEVTKDNGGIPWQLNGAVQQARNELELAEAYGNTTSAEAAHKRLQSLGDPDHQEERTSAPRGRRTAPKSTT